MASKILYPPLIDSSMPSFNYEENPNIYFSFPPMNSIDDINRECLQFILVDQDTNKTVLSDLNEIEFAEVQEDDSGYYFVISANVLKKMAWIKNKIYKLQIRFTDKDIIYKAPKSTWLSENLDSFSEWSTVCLIKPIVIPTVKVKLDTIYKSDTLIYSAKLLFNNSNSINEEYLSSYKLTLKKELYEKTIQGFPKELNEINEVFPQELVTGNYSITLEYYTNNNYSNKITTSFTVDLSLNTLSGNFNYSSVNEYDAFKDTGVLDLENARVRLQWSDIEQNGNILIKRSSSKNNFSIWEDLCLLPYSQEGSYLDYTVESGIFYKYKLYVKDDNKIYGPLSYNKPIILLFDYAYLSDKNYKLKLKFDTQISSFKINVLEGVTQTIGATYPYIRRNGNSYYKTFPISGLISSLIDTEHTFINDDILYDENTELYEQYALDNNISNYNNYIKEKLFREQVLQFLYNSKAKLFRSPSEGNVLIKLTDINLTPNQTLGRMLYSFSATATEIAEPTLDNLQKYEIIEEV